MKINAFEKLSPIEKRTLIMAKYIRDKMEEYHCKNLTDDQMKELNQLIRNTICEFFIMEKNEDLLFDYMQLRVFLVLGSFLMKKRLLKKCTRNRHGIR